MNEFNISQELRNTVQQYFSILMKMEKENYTSKPAPGKWSAKEIMGHLIDSAANNHQRFVRAQLQDNLLFQGYQQEEWVTLQDYQNGDWEEILILWKAYNMHLATVVEKIPEEILYKEYLEHTLDRIAWKVVPKEEPATLAYFIEDYLGHMKMHLRQVEERLKLD